MLFVPRIFDFDCCLGDLKGCLTLYGHKHDFVQGNKPLCRLYYSSDSTILKLNLKKIQFPVFFIYNKI